MALTITDGLNALNDAGFFSYVIPFLLIFAVVYAILTKTKILGGEKPIITIVSAALALLSLQFDIVSIFYANIFPKFGVGLAVLLVILIFLAFFGVDETLLKDKKFKWIGGAIAVAVLLWTFSNWNTWWNSGLGAGWWLQEYFWSLVILAIVIGAIVWAISSNSGDGGTG